MLERLLKLYVMAMAGDVRSPLPHLFGPPGCGKSTAVEQLAKLLGVNLHIINVSRISPLEVEGVQMPMGMDTGDPRLHLLTATFWTQLKDGDILLLDEFLRAFPEVYNALLDILTSRQVGGFKLPKVFIVGASNSTVAYDKALEDRLLHIPAEDLRGPKGKRARDEQAALLVEVLGLMPSMTTTMEIQNLLSVEVLPMYNIMDSLGKGSSAVVMEGRSMRNLIGQAQLREVQSDALAELLTYNNREAVKSGKYQYLFLFDPKKNQEFKDAKTKDRLNQLVGNKKLTEVQARNLNLNLQLIGMEEQRRTKEVPHVDVNDEFDDAFFN